MAQNWTIDMVESYLASETHHGKPGLSAAKKMALVRALEPLARQWIPLLLTSPVAGAREVAAHLIAPLWAANPEYELAVMQLATDDDWEVREWAVAPFVDRYAAQPDRAFRLYCQWAETAADGVKRALAVAIKGLSSNPNLAPEPLWEIVDRMVTFKSSYLRQNLGPFCVGDSLLPRHPDLGLAYCLEWAERAEWPARWNAAAAFTAKRSKPWIDLARPFLEMLVQEDPEASVRRIAQKALK